MSLAFAPSILHRAAPLSHRSSTSFRYVHPFTAPSVHTPRTASTRPRISLRASADRTNPLETPPNLFLKTSGAPHALPDNLIATAQAAADAAGVILRKHFRTPLPVDFKADDSPVTRADRLAEDAIRAIILKQFPTHVVIGEESTQSYDPDQQGYVWVIDPIDGTRAFVCGRPTFTTLIALLHNGLPLVGIIDQPVTRERWLGVQGLPTTLNGVRVSTRARPHLSGSVLQATTPEMFRGIDAVKFRKVARVARNVVYGGDAYAYAQLASGCGDVVVEADLKPWDMLALVPVVEGAGGVMGDWGGAMLGLRTDGRVVAAASGDLFEEIVTILGVAEDRGLVPGTSQVSSNLPVVTNGLPVDPGVGYMESMTGYGRAVVDEKGYMVGAQMRSVNSRFCEVQVRGAGVLSGHESQMINIVKKIALRGRISVTLDISFQGGEQQKTGVKVDKDAVKEVTQLLSEVGAAAGAGSPTISDVMRFSEVLVREDSGMVVVDLLPVAKKAVALATENLCASRRREGAMLEEDILKRTRKIMEIVEDVEQRAGDRVTAERARLTKILDAVVEREVSMSRLETEVTLFADRVDFTEEVVRLRSHVTIFELTLVGADEPIGQRLTFLLQEMHREANTLAAKASDAPVSHLAVLVKEEIEKIREQCCNIR